MATQNGLEPSTSSVTGWHSNQLNYWATYYLRKCYALNQGMSVFFREVVWLKLLRKCYALNQGMSVFLILRYAGHKLLRKCYALNQGMSVFFREAEKVGGDNRARTYDPLLVRQMLSQLSYAPAETCDII